MKDLSDGSLRISVTQADDKRTAIKWIGSSDSRQPRAVLDPFFDELLPTLVGKKCVMDFRALDFMNSSTAPPMMRAVKKMDEMGIDCEVVYLNEVGWQRASFRALAAVAVRLPHIKVTGA